MSFESSQHYNFRYDELMKMVEQTNGIVPEAQKQIIQKVDMYTWGFETLYCIQMYEIIYHINFIHIILEH